MVEMTTKAQLIEENAELKARLKTYRSKETCYYCKGTGKRWTYGMDGEESCCYCQGSGRL